MTIKSNIGLYAEQIAGKYLTDKSYECPIHDDIVEP